MCDERRLERSGEGPLGARDERVEATGEPTKTGESHVRRTSPRAERRETVTPPLHTEGMKIVSLKLVDPATLQDDDTWIESCAQCGTLENSGDLLCLACDDLAA